jgi:ATP-dependent RNA helicase DeaD
MNAQTQAMTFESLNLAPELRKALADTGYETPTPIQAESIPVLLTGRDLVGHAPTGTGKTAAFALPLLCRIDMPSRQVQGLILVPTRELAIQVAEAFQRYAAHLPDFRVLPIYGGQGYDTQLRQLKRGVHVVVGTPGRVMDHMRRGTLNLENLHTLVLDEADEMLRMGFIDDVQWVLDRTPPERQLVLFSATMPPEIERIARSYLRDPHDISIRARTATAETIRQRYWLVSGLHKLDALTRILEVEAFEAMLIFVRTKTATLELAEKLEARGYGAAALNGDMAQTHREQMIGRLKSGALDILIATDVAARGLDVDRISHVVNYDIPHDTESYIHRIGRTGRAGRQGDAILFVAAREKRLLASIERATRQRITPLELPTVADVTSSRVARFKQRITDALQSAELPFMQGVIEQYQQEHAVTPVEIAAALGCMVFGNRPLVLPTNEQRIPAVLKPEEHRPLKDFSAESFERRQRPPREMRITDDQIDTYRIEVGADHGVAPGNLVGAIANEAGLDAAHIGRIVIHAEYSTVDLPKGMPKAIFNDLSKAWVCGRQMQLSKIGAPDLRPSEARQRILPADRAAKTPVTRKPKKDSLRNDSKKSKPAFKRKDSRPPQRGSGR